jgi:sigma-E factor negative regulatory protein RseA
MKDQISALMDDELPLASSEHLLTATYHLIGDTLRGNPVFKPDFTERLMQKLDAEPTVLAPQAKKPSIKSSAMWSVAASVAAVMFVGWFVMQQQVQNGVDVAPVEIAQNLPSEYLLAHQSSAPSGAAYYIQPASYAEGGK